MKDWFKSGAPWVWLTGGAVALSVLMVVGVLSLIAARGLVHFWPKMVIETTFQERDGSSSRLIGEIRETEEVSVRRLVASGFDIKSSSLFVNRMLVKLGNRDVTGVDFRWFPEPLLGELTYPKDVVVIERREWGNFYGHLKAVKESDQVVAEGDAAWPELQKRFNRATDLFDQIYKIEKNDIGDINYRLEQLRLEQRRAELGSGLTDAIKADLAKRRVGLDAEFLVLQETLQKLRSAIGRDTLVAEIQDGQTKELKLAMVADLYQPNTMTLFQKMGHYVKKLTEFLVEDPREANTEGGIFPAIFGTVLMVLMMSVIVTPFGIMAAIYMREYAKQGPLIRIIRISVNNLAGVPSIVYGVFGLGFFVYFLGGNIDQLFFAEA